MSAAIPITRLDRTASELRSFASRCDDGAQVRRVLAIALVLEGRSRAEAAEQNGMDRQTLSDWVHRYNAGGIDGLKSCHGPGATPLLSDAEKAARSELQAEPIRQIQRTNPPTCGRFRVDAPRCPSAWQRC